MKLAVTGGTGFVGAHLIDQALEAGHAVNALTRRTQPVRDGVTWIAGDLADRLALKQLVEGADAVIHVAGVLSARKEAEFEQGNVLSTQAVLDAAATAGVRRFVHISSLAAREPSLSMYGASKARAEALVEQSGLAWVIVRPPAVYGPGDKETLELFRMARRRLIAMPPAGRASYLHVDDLSRLLVVLARVNVPAATILEPDDGRPGGWSHRQFGAALAEAVGVPAITVETPRLVLEWGARLDRLIRGHGAKLTPDRVAYFCHSDWTVDPAKAPPPGLWAARVDTPRGLKDTASWYRAQGWL
ncbi:MAG: NAD-dependent epimerase/dehydratase family protein [Sphingomicrobium sp.]